MTGIPETIGKYKIVSLVAKGGMGAVYKAVHPSLRRYVIIKKLTIRGNASIIERFKREAQILLDFNDPRIVHLFDYFQEGSSRYIVLEYVDGMSLDVLIKKRRYLSGPLALLIFLDACKALKYAHEKGVIHRDIKPGNILISKTGEVKLADFGIAATERDETDSALTREGMTLGTPSYMPPEQFENSKNVDKRADVYAMGVMLYEMVTGKKPFPGSLAPETINLIQKGRFVPARKLNPDIPPLVSRLIRKMIRPDPRKRFKDISQAISLIEKFFNRYPVQDIRANLVDCLAKEKHEEPVFRPRTRKRVLAVLLLAFSVAATAGMYTAWTGGHINRIFRGAQLGPVRVRISMPAAVRPSADAVVRAELFINDRADFPDVPGAALRFRVDTASSTDQLSWFVSNQVFLAPGAYRIKVTAEQRIWWQSFRVESYRDLRSREMDELLLEFAYGTPAPRPLVVRTAITDAISGRSLSSSAQVTVQQGNRWVPLSELESGTLRTGAVHRFRAEAEGYYNEVFSLRIGPSQDELELRASLVPLHGTLVLTGPGDQRVAVTLNGSQIFTAGGPDMPSDSFAGYSGDQGSWQLPAGRYELEVAGRKSRTRAAFAIVPEGRTRLRVVSDAGMLSIIRE